MHTLNKQNIEQESLVILNELIKHKLNGSEIVLGHALITFIQYFLITEKLHPESYLAVMERKIGNVHFSKLNNALLGISPNRNRRFLSNIKEILAFVFLNIKFKNEPLVKYEFNYTAKYDWESLPIIEPEKIELIYQTFIRNLKTDSSRTESFISACLSIFPFYSGKFVYNPTILQAFQIRRNKGYSSFSIQHGGHNYVSSNHNVFLYPEYGDYFIPIVAGSLIPKIHLYKYDIVYLVAMTQVNEIKQLAKNRLEKIALILGHRIYEPFRIDGNPLFNEWLGWNKEVKDFVRRNANYKWSIKYYPGQISSMRPYFADYDDIESIEDCYSKFQVIVCDHYGTTFLQSMRKGYLCLLFLDLSIFNIRKDVLEIISPFIISQKTSGMEIQNRYDDWNSGRLDRDRGMILQTLYGSEKIF